MKSSKLSNLFAKLQELSDEASGLQNEYAVETINDDLSRNLKGGTYDNSNGSCDNSTNKSCSNGTCNGSNNTSCANGSCLPSVPVPTVS